MLFQTLASLVAFADKYSLTVYAVLALIWVVALGCYIVGKVAARRTATSGSAVGKPAGGIRNVERICPELVAKAPARI